MIELLIMRHGEAGWNSGIDAERELTERGEEQAQRASVHFLGQGWLPDVLIASPYTRTQQTAAWLSHAWDLPVQSCDWITPDCDPQAVMASLDALAEEKSDGRNALRIAMVSHNPLVTNLIALLTGREPRECAMDTASSAMLHSDVIATGVADLQWLRHSDNYPKLV